ncbi:VIT domain-containing protein [Prosthecobacter sp.]|uniref:VIT domain-containing protein n=1 Tax=Prosthecobacter sp. TaxID=1965333 RepID=UPI00378341DE
MLIPHTTTNSPSELNTTETPFGLTAWMNDLPVTLPLRHVEARFQILGDVVLMEIDQVFEQTADAAMNVIYTFPVPAGAAVHRCEMIVNGRVIRAVVMAEEKARQVVKEHQAAGHRTTLMEMIRDNLFTLELGNVAPGDRIAIRFAYLETMERQASQMSIRIPFSPGVRYVPGRPLLRENSGPGVMKDTDEVPDASRISPPRLSAGHPEAATMHLEGMLDAESVDMRTLNSPSHATSLRRVESGIEVTLAANVEVPGRDFVLRWEESAVAVVSTCAWVATTAEARYALLQIRAPQSSGPAAEDDFTQDVYFLLDRSGSMDGTKWEKAAQALHVFVRALGKNDRVWLTCFESDYRDFDTKPLGRDELLGKAAFQKLAEIGTGGGTELLPALTHVLEMRARHSSGRRARLVLITDGQVANEDALCECMKQKDAATLPVHCFGIDHMVNDELLKALAKQTGGRCALLTPEDDIAAAVGRLSETLRRPVLVSLELQGGHLPAHGSSRLPDLHAGEVSLLAIRCEPGATAAVVTGLLPDGSSWSHRFELQEGVQGHAECAPRLIWARRRIQHLLSLRQEDEAVALAIEHNLICRGAAFVAWDEVEQVKVATTQLYQPCAADMMDAVEFECAPCPEAPVDEGPDELREVLIEEGIPYSNAVKIALYLQSWVYSGDEDRYELFDKLVLEMQNSLEPVECLRRFIDEHILEEGLLAYFRAYVPAMAIQDQGVPA